MNKFIAFAGFAVIVFALLFFGCTQTPPAAPTPSPAASLAASPSPSPLPSPSPSPTFAPLKLEYELKTMNGNQQETVNVVYFFESEKTCDGKKAWAGVIKAFSPSQPQSAMWLKTSVYLDNGVAGYSQQLSENELAFPAAKSQRSDFDLAFFMNSLFYSVGENFVGNAVWNSSEPIILHNATVFGNEPDDVSVFKTGAGSGVVPCTEFSVVGKQGGGIAVCVTEPTKENPLSYVVYVKPKGQDQGPGFGWGLKSTSSDKSGVTKILQCLTPVKCASVKQPSGDERSACERDGKTMQETRDEQNCVKSYACTAPGVRVKVFAPDGSPVPNVEVTLSNAGGSQPLQTQRTDSQGTAVFNVGPGEYDLGFAANAFPSQYSGPDKLRVVVNAGGTAQAEVHLTAK